LDHIYKIYRLITVKTVEAECFKCASLKLGLEQAVLGAAAKSSSLAELEGGAEKLSAKEMEALIRKGAYSMLDDDDSEADKFVETDIDTILSSSRRVVTQQTSKTAAVLNGMGAVTKTSFQHEQGDSLSIDDPNFWAKVLGEELSVSSLLIRLTSKQESLAKSVESRQSFMVEVEVLMARLMEKKGAGKTSTYFDTEQQSEQQLEANAAQRLLLLLSDHNVMEEVGFTKQQCDQAVKWWVKIDEQHKASAIRRCTQDGVNRRYYGEKAVQQKGNPIWGLGDSPAAGRAEPAVGMRIRVRFDDQVHLALTSCTHILKFVHVCSTQCAHTPNHTLSRTGAYTCTTDMHIKNYISCYMLAQYHIPALNTADKQMADLLCCCACTDMVRRHDFILRKN
jgi:hypothetical protein